MADGVTPDTSQPENPPKPSRKKLVMIGVMLAAFFVGYIGFGWPSGGKYATFDSSSVELEVTSVQIGGSAQPDWQLRIWLPNNHGDPTACDCELTVKARTANQTEWIQVAHAHADLWRFPNRTWTQVIEDAPLCGDLEFRVVAREDRFLVIKDRIFTNEKTEQMPC